MKTKALTFLLLCPFLLHGQAPKPGPYHFRKAAQFSRYPVKRSHIVMLGNSITDGAQWDELFGNRNIINRGISADKSFDILSRLDPIVEGRPDKVFLMVGVNDLAAGYTPREVASNIEEIARRLADRSSRTRLYIQSVLPVNDTFTKFGGHVSKGKEIKELNELLRQLCLERDIRYIDLHTIFSDGSGRLDANLTNDGLHLIGPGYLLWKAVLTPYINE